MEEIKLLEIINRTKNFLENNDLYGAKEYIQIEINNLTDVTQEHCKNTIYHFYDSYCKYCTNINCGSNKNH